MAATGVRVTGLREVVRDLERLGVEVEDLKGAFLEISEDVAGEARARVRRRTGALAGSIRPARTKSKAVVRAGNSTSIAYARVQDARTQFLTGPANEDPEGKARTIDRNLAALIRKYT